MENNVRHGWAWIRTELKNFLEINPYKIWSLALTSPSFFFFLLNANIELMEKVSEKLKFTWALESSVVTNECHRTNHPAILISDLVVTSTWACSRKAHNRAIVQEDTKQSIYSYNQQSLQWQLSRTNLHHPKFLYVPGRVSAGSLGDSCLIFFTPKTSATRVVGAEVHIHKDGKCAYHNVNISLHVKKPRD